jgi:hypothetical protein
MKINFFNEQSALYDFRWFIIITIAISAFMAWHDIQGGRIFASSAQQQWASSGPGYHK